MGTYWLLRCYVVAAYGMPSGSLTVFIASRSLSPFSWIFLSLAILEKGAPCILGFFFLPAPVTPTVRVVLAGLGLSTDEPPFLPFHADEVAKIVLLLLLPTTPSRTTLDVDPIVAGVKRCKSCRGAEHEPRISRNMVSRGATVPPSTAVELALCGGSGFWFPSEEYRYVFTPLANRLTMFRSWCRN